MSPQLAKVVYTWTTDDVNNGFAVVHVQWRSPMSSNYVVVWSVNDLSASANDADYWQGDMHNIKSDGFDAVVYVYSAGADYSTAGTKLIVNAIAFEWNQGA